MPSRGLELAQTNAKAVTVRLVIDGQVVSGTQQPPAPAAAIPCGGKYNAEIYWFAYKALVGPLSVGQHTAEYTYFLSQPITLGFDANGDGVNESLGAGAPLPTERYTIVVK